MQALARGFVHVQASYCPTTTHPTTPFVTCGREGALLNSGEDPVLYDGGSEILRGI